MLILHIGEWKYLGACPRIGICRVPSAAWADARRRDAGNAGTLSRSANEADAHAAGPLREPSSAGILWDLGPKAQPHGYCG